MRPLFISFEGPDGSGKSSVMQKVGQHLIDQGLSIYLTREPGGRGSVIAETIRDVILDVDHTAMSPRCEALLYAAARAQHISEIIKPQLAKGNWVLSDRFVDSSYVYQSGARGLPLEEIEAMNQFATDGLMPDLTILIDVPAEVGLERIYRAQGTRQFDRLDQENLDFHQRVRQGFVELAERTARIHSVDGTQSMDDVVADCLSIIQNTIQEETR